MSAGTSSHVLIRFVANQGRSCLWLLVLAIIFTDSLCLLPAAEQKDEQQLIQILRSEASLQEKDAACIRLKRIGTEQCIPALGELLTHAQLSHSARYALESMPSPQAGDVLIKALGTTSGLIRLGIINSLAVRRESQAVPALATLLAAQSKSRPAHNEETANSAAAALGEIGTPAAIHALEVAVPSSSEPLDMALADALLRSANHLLASGNETEAQALFRRIPAGTNDWLRIATEVGVLRASGKAASRMFAEALSGPPGPKQTAALELVREAKFEGASQTFAELLLRVVATPVQISILEGLAQRNDPAVGPAIASLARKSDMPVRVAALRSLGALGNDSAVPLLAEAAASGTPEEQAAGRQALVEIHLGKVTDALLKEMADGRAAQIQAEAARALGQRGDADAFPKLLEIARGDNASRRAAALPALALLATEQHIGDLIQLVADARAETVRSQAVEALNTALQRLQSSHRMMDLTFLVKVIESGPADIRIALLGVCSGLSEPQLRPGLRHAVADSNPAVRAAAIRALCDTHDLELLPDALKVATSAPEAKFRALATAACVRLTSQEEGARLPNEVRLAPMKTLLAGHPSAAEKRMVLAGLAEIPDAQALSLSEALLGDPGVQAEAARTVIKIAPTVADTSLATGALKKVLGMTGNSGTLEAAQAALKQIQARSDWVTSWEAAGPYRQTGKDYAALFDITFVPEQTLERKPQGPGGSNSDTTPVNWQPLPPGLDPAHPGVMDLLKQYGGEQCVAYARTRIYSPAKQSALLDLGTDDGVKVWLNERLVHGKNVARPLLPGSDKVELNLNEGWNDLLLKVTQNNLGWEFCARVLKPDGSHLEGLKFAASP